jgi:hypothetical protein
MWVSANLVSIKSRLASGLTAHEVANELNVRGRGYINGWPWNANGVLGMIKLDEAIRRQDAIIRAERQKKAYEGFSLSGV